MIKAAIIFSHASTDVNVPGLEFKGQQGRPFSGTVSHTDIQTLPVLDWASDGDLHLQGCNTGLLAHRKGLEPIGEAFSTSQGTVVYGEAGYTYFSEDDSKYIEIDKKGTGTSIQVYLKAYKRAQNGFFGNGKVIPPVKFEPVPSPVPTSTPGSQGSSVILP